MIDFNLHWCKNKFLIDSGVSTNCLIDSGWCLCGKPIFLINSLSILYKALYQIINFRKKYRLNLIYFELQTQNRLRVDWDDDPEKFRHAAHNVARDPQVIAHVDALTRTHLIFPLHAKRITQLQYGICTVRVFTLLQYEYYNI